MQEYTIKEAAEYLGISEFGIRSAIYSRKAIPYTKIGLKVKIKRKDLDLYVQRDKIRIGQNTKRYSSMPNLPAEWLTLYRNAYTFSQIAEKYGCPRAAVTRVLKKNFPEFDFGDYNNRLTEEDKIIFRKAKDEYYQNPNTSLGTVCVNFKISLSKFRNYLTRNGGIIKSYSEVGSLCTNPDFFNNIDNEVKAYLLGFFAADGHIETRKDYNSYTLRVGVHKNDAHILMLYNKFLCNNQLSISVKSGDGINQASFALTSKKLGEALHCYGFDNHKTHTWKNLPIIPSDMYPHFIRGYFDGDGSIMVDRCTAKGRLSGYNKRCVFVCFNKEILEQIIHKIGLSNEDYLLKLNKSTNKLINSKLVRFRASYTLEITNTTTLRRVHEYLYQNAKYYFKRKKDKFDLAILETQQIDATLQGNL